MKRSLFVAICLTVLAAVSAIAAPNPSTEKVPAFPGILVNARYVYVPRMTEISSIRTCFPRIKLRLALFRTRFRNGAN